MSGLPKIPNSPSAQSFVSFLAVGIAAAVGTKLFSGGLSEFPDLLVWACVVMALSVVFLVGTVSGRVTHLLKQAETSVVYVDEPADHEGRVRGTGEVHKALRKSVLEAKKTVRVLATTWSPFPEGPEDLESRNSYLKAIEDSLEKYSGNDFQYFRILQSPPGQPDAPLNKFVDSDTLKHCQRVLTRHGKQVTIQRISRRRSGGFVVIDDRVVILGLDGAGPHGEPFFAGSLTVTDLGGRVVSRWLDLFGRMKDAATIVPLEQIERAVESHRKAATKAKK